MKRSEIITALRLCRSTFIGANDCKICPYRDMGTEEEHCYDVLASDAADALEKQETKIEKITSLFSVYDRETVIENCTVQILENTETGEVSVGWKRNGETEEG